MTQKKLIAGNWKMNGLTVDTDARVKALADFVARQDNLAFEMVLCPPATMAERVVGLLSGGASISCGGQDCHAEASGAYTGNISAEMLKDLGCTHVIVGHSERRAYHNETDEIVAAKATAAHVQGLVAIICVGEVEADRDAGRQNDVVATQLSGSLPETATPDNTVVAYEPVWAIGTGKTASAEDVNAMHAFIREKVGAGMRLLYGGSVKPGNAAEILHIPNVDGVLVGGASLKAEDFQAIAEAA